MSDKKLVVKKAGSIPIIIKKFFETQHLAILAVWLFAAALISLILISPYITKGLNLKIGDKSEVQIVSPEYFEFQTSANQIETIRLKELATAKIKDIYSVDKSVNQSVNKSVTSFFSGIEDIRAGKKSPNPLGINVVSDNVVSELVHLDSIRFRDFQTAVLGSINGMLDQGVTKSSEELIQAIDTVIAASVELNKNRSLAHIILTTFTRQNSFFDKNKTEKLKRTIANSIAPLKTVFREGQTILFVGDIVTEDHYNILKKIGYVGFIGNFNKILSLIFVVILLVVLLERFIFYFKPQISSNFKYVLLINLFLLCAILAAKAASFLPDLSLQFLIPFDPIPQPQYVSFIVMFIMLLVMLVDREIALFTGIIASLFVGIVFSSINVCIYNAVISSFTVFNIAGVYERKDLTKAGFNVGLISVITILVLYENHSPINILFAVLGGLVSCILSAVFSIGIIPYFESVFGISSSMLYIELSNPNHPLLRRLMIEAPGTYHHSTIVASLAEAATEAIGGNYLLARVGGFYHDVGKIKRPYFFVENQLRDDNPHNKLSPRLSAIIILSHTKEGVELAREYGIPDEILNIIECHHGDSLVYYFYQKYLQKENVEMVSEDQFRYPGPLPSTKEAAVIMLADTIEAAVRSMEKPSPTKIEALVKRIVKEKIDDAQITNSPLSLAELEKIKHSLIKTLGGIYHARIDYSPEKIAKELEAKKDHNNSSNKR